MLPRPRGLMALVVVLICSYQPASTLAQTASRQKPVPHVPHVTDQKQFIAYWTTETGWQSELQLRNNLSSQDLTVTPALRSTDGTETPLAPVTIRPQEVKSIEIATAIPATAPQLIGAFGSIILRYRSVGSNTLYAALMLHNTGHSIAFHIDATAQIEKYDAAAREGIWWLPNDGADGYLVLANQGKDALPLALSLYDASGKESKRNVLLGSGETSRYSIRQLVQAAGLAGLYGGIKVYAPAHAGSLDTLHFIFDQKVGFSALMKMFDHDPGAKIEERDFAQTSVWTLRAPMLALTHPDSALAFPVDVTLQPQLLLRNTTEKPVSASLRFSWRGDNNAVGKAQGPALQLIPHETRRIDVAALQDGKTLPKEARWTSVTLTTNTKPDELMTIATSYDPTLQYGAQTPFSDQLSLAWEGGQWEYDPLHNSLITAGNGGTKPTRAAFTIFYNQGTQRYDLEQTLQPDEQMWINIGGLIREHVPDKNGKALPADLTSGSYEFRDLTDPIGGSLFEGKVIYDKTYGHVTYGCAECCPITDLYLTYDPLDIPFQGTAPNTVIGTNCNGSHVDISSRFYFDWSTVNSAVATVDNYGTHTGDSVGATTSSTYGFLPTPVGLKCPSRMQTVAGNDNVMPKILLGGSSGTDITNTTQTVVVGQQIVLYGSYGNITPTSQSWSVSGTTVGGFSTASTSGGPTSTDFSQRSTTFYWVVAANSQTVTFTLYYGNNQSASASATFNVAGPSAVSVSVSRPGQGQGRNNGTTSASIQFGSTLGTPGVQFTGHATSPSQAAGTYEWAQLINQNNYTYTIGTTTTSCNGPAGLDNSFPTSTGFYFSDSPARGLPSADNKFTWTWNATAYFMWIPGLNNSIAVPLGYVSWQFFSDTIQNGPNTWSIQADSSASAGSFQASSSYIQWTSTATNGSLGACQ